MDWSDTELECYVTRHSQQLQNWPYYHLFYIQVQFDTQALKLCFQVPGWGIGNICLVSGIVLVVLAGSAFAVKKFMC